MKDEDKLEAFADFYDNDMAKSVLSMPDIGVTEQDIASKRPKILENLTKLSKTRGVDWEVGMPHLFRGGLSRSGNIEEQEDFLNRAVGNDGWYRIEDEYVVKKDRAKQYGVKTDRDVGIDPAGFDMADISPVGDLAGIAMPMVASFAGALRATPYSAMAGMALTGAYAAAGKLIDEAVQYAPVGKGGLLSTRQLQGPGEIAKDVAGEAMFAGSAEGVVRGLGAAARYVLSPGKRYKYVSPETGDVVRADLGLFKKGKGQLLGVQTPYRLARRGQLMDAGDEKLRNKVSELIKRGYVVDIDQGLGELAPALPAKLQKATHMLFGGPSRRNRPVIEMELERLGLSKLDRDAIMRDATVLGGKLLESGGLLGDEVIDAAVAGKELFRSGIRDTVEEALKLGWGKVSSSGAAGDLLQDGIVRGFNNGKTVAGAYYQNIHKLLQKYGIKDGKVIDMRVRSRALTNYLSKKGLMPDDAGYKKLSASTQDYIESILKPQGRMSFPEAHTYRSQMIEDAWDVNLATKNVEKNVINHIEKLYTETLENLQPMGGRFAGAIDGVQQLSRGLKAKEGLELSAAFNLARGYWKGMRHEFDYHKIAKLLRDETVQQDPKQVARLILSSSDPKAARAAKEVFYGRFGADIKETARKVTEETGVTFKFGKGLDLEATPKWDNVVTTFLHELFEESAKIADRGGGDLVRSGTLLKQLKNLRNAKGKTFGGNKENTLDIMVGRQNGDKLLAFAKQLEGYGHDMKLKDLNRIIASGKGWQTKLMSEMKNQVKHLEMQDYMDKNTFFSKMHEMSLGNEAPEGVIDALWNPKNESMVNTMEQFFKGFEAKGGIKAPLQEELRDLGMKKFMLDNFIDDGKNAIEHIFTGGELKKAMFKYKRSHLEKLLGGGKEGAEHYDAMLKLAEAVEHIEKTKPLFSAGSIVTAGLPYHPLQNKGMLFKLGAAGGILSSKTAMKWLSEGLLQENPKLIMEGLVRAGLIVGGQSLSAGAKATGDRGELQFRRQQQQLMNSMDETGRF